MKIDKYMKDNNTDEFPNKEELLSNNNIKNGVQELFDSNPDLANQVYKALGFEEDSTLESKLKTFFNNFGFEFKEGDLSTDYLIK